MPNLRHVRLKVLRSQPIWSAACDIVSEKSGILARLATARVGDAIAVACESLGDALPVACESSPSAPARDLPCGTHRGHSPGYSHASSQSSRASFCGAACTPR